MNRTFKPDQQKFQTLITWNLLIRSSGIFTGSRLRTTSVPSWVVPWLPPTNPRWRRPPSLISEMSITLHWMKISAPILWKDALRPCVDHHVTKSQNRKSICVTVGGCPLYRSRTLTHDKNWNVSCHMADYCHNSYSKCPSFCPHTCAKSSVPLVNYIVNDGLVNAMPNMPKTLHQFRTLV